MKKTVEEESSGKHIYVVLSRSGTILSHIIHWITRDTYTHAALALDEDMELLFSFGRRWSYNPFIGCFKHERLNDRLYVHGRPGAIVKIPVSARQYEEIYHHVRMFSDNPKAYSYNLTGLITGIFHRTFEGSHRFFCSEFVYYILNEAGVCDFGISRGHVRPQMFLQTNGHIVFEGKLPVYMRMRRDLYRFHPAV